MARGRFPTLQATKSVSQPHRDEVLKELLQRCLRLTYNGMKYGEDNHTDDRSGMKEFYRSLKGIDIPSCYKVASITRACAVLKSREKGERRGKVVKHRTALRPVICITTGFFTTVTGKLFISLGHGKYEMVQLNRYAHQKIREPRVKVRSLTITKDSMSFCYSKEVLSIPEKTVYGVDRDVNAAMILSERGLARLASSHPRSEARKLTAGEKGPAGEAMTGERTTPVILGVDAGKLPSTEDATETHSSKSLIGRGTPRTPVGDNIGPRFEKLAEAHGRDDEEGRHPSQGALPRLWRHPLQVQGEGHLPHLFGDGERGRVG
jgi:hypothetical protein